jgi:Protein of unknown function (DUF2911)
MTFQRRIVTAALIATIVAPVVAIAQDLHPSRRPSPLGIARTMLGDTYVRVIYSRPYKRGRANVFGTKESGALVPYGERWRTGANEATEITVTNDVLVAGKKLPAGTYSLSTTPGPDTWTVHFNSRLGLDGLGTFANDTFTPVDLAPTDVLVISVPPTQLPEDKDVDQLTFEFEKAGSGTDMVLRWIRTEVRVPITAPR